MSRKLFVTYFFLVFIAISCENNKSSNDKEHASTLSETDTNPKDSTRIAANHQSGFKESEDNFQSDVNRKLNIDSLIEQYPSNQYAELRNHMKWLIEEWGDAPNPITARYQGNDFGDYHHILFEDSNGKAYDFGQANNNYGQYELHESSGHYHDNPEYLGQAFQIYWDWELAKFLCCDGEFGEASAHLPTIKELKLVKY